MYDCAWPGSERAPGRVSEERCRGFLSGHPSQGCECVCPREVSGLEYGRVGSVRPECQPALHPRQVSGLGSRGADPSTLLPPAVLPPSKCCRNKKQRSLWRGEGEAAGEVGRPARPGLAAQACLQAAVASIPAGPRGPPRDKSGPPAPRGRSAHGPGPARERRRPAPGPAGPPNHASRCAPGSALTPSARGRRPPHLAR